MQDIDAVRVFQRVHHSKCIAAKIGDDFQHARASKTGQHLGIAMLAATLRDVDRIAHVPLDRMRKHLQILAARSHPDKRLERQLIDHLRHYSAFTIFGQGLANPVEDSLLAPHYRG